ncbi:MAG TPA: autotransporter outer membrane beta-barrel domain-containing protein [Acidocella sp.]|uniref:autotransporter outer membrane beta-barrel domain-containing protein n=1 Tax=Acidocella sp. TaxID=50710 RepID=UPI002CB87523|nr:autotransporter outer membrane beta-barrel domain-containing protein [Acidocella sp.]HVE22710.1 autotransporter outer membrane beta-barrel domain-containing protein [Acidocella sp.]
MIPQTAPRRAAVAAGCRHVAGRLRAETALCPAGLSWLACGAVLLMLASPAQAQAQARCGAGGGATACDPPSSSPAGSTDFGGHTGPTDPGHGSFSAPGHGGMAEDPDGHGASDPHDPGGPSGSGGRGSSDPHGPGGSADPGGRGSSGHHHGHGGSTDPGGPTGPAGPSGPSGPTGPTNPTDPADPTGPAGQNPPGNTGATGPKDPSDPADPVDPLVLSAASGAGDPAADPSGGPGLRPEFSAYGAAIPTAQVLGLDTLGTLYDRIGDERIGLDSSSAGLRASSVWGRAFGAYVGAAYGGQAQARTSGSEVGVQLGLDLYRHIAAHGGRDFFGTYFSYANAQVGTSGLVTDATDAANIMEKTGTDNVNAYSGGLYYTHFGPSGWYADIVVQGTRYGGTAASTRTSIPLTGDGFAASLELGVPFALRPGLALEPQAQLVWQGVWLADQSDAFGTVQPGGGATLYGRIGAQLNGVTQTGAWQLRPYARTNLWSALAGTSSSILYAGVESITTKADATWTQLGLGLTARRSDSRFSFYAHIDGLVGLKNAGTNRYGFDGGAGLKYEW